jgi:hypothetical protein
MVAPLPRVAVGACSVGAVGLCGPAVPERCGVMVWVCGATGVPPGAGAAVGGATPGAAPDGAAAGAGAPGAGAGAGAVVVDGA